MKLSFISTVFNEEKNISQFFKSIAQQSKLPDEIIIVDGGSTDRTVELLEKELAEFRKYNKRIKVELAVKKGNRSLGRNEAIRIASGEIIACSDAGCILDKNWFKNITSVFSDNVTDVAAGYYDGLSSTVFQKCLIPYVLVMPDRVSSHTFLPSTRSIAFKREVWEKVNGFPEKLEYSEDFWFARKVKKMGFKIKFVRNAIVHWIPRNDFNEAAKMFYRFAKGDVCAKIYRPKVLFIFLRYLIVIVLFSIQYMTKSQGLIFVIFLFFILYCIYAVRKNYKYVKNWRALYILPILQFISDSMVILGTVVGIIKRV